MQMILNALKQINYKLYFSLIIFAFIPIIYNTTRVYFIGEMPNEYSYSIASQLQWVNLIFEILQEGIILPLYFFIGEVIRDKKEFINRVKTGLLFTFCIYSIFSIIVIVFTEPLLKLMSATSEIIPDSITYIRLESVAGIISILLNFSIVVLVSIGKNKYFYIFTFVKLFLCLFFDLFLISPFDFSMNIGVDGIAISNILVNMLLFIVIIGILTREDINLFTKEKLNFTWIGAFLKQSVFSRLESLIRNLAYMIMICKMVNAVNEQGTYWMANNYIWGWLLVPILQLGELIKKDCGSNNESMNRKKLGYFIITSIVCLLWIISIPLYKPFMKYVLNYNETEKLFQLVVILLIPYIFFAFQNIVDSVFYGVGKTQYMLLESVVTNTIYYGIAFILYKLGIFQPSLRVLHYCLVLGLYLMLWYLLEHIGFIQINTRCMT